MSELATMGHDMEIRGAGRWGSHNINEGNRRWQTRLTRCMMSVCLKLCSTLSCYTVKLTWRNIIYYLHAGQWYEQINTDSVHMEPHKATTNGIGRNDGGFHTQTHAVENEQTHNKTWTHTENSQNKASPERASTLRQTGAFHTAGN